MSPKTANVSLNRQNVQQVLADYKSAIDSELQKFFDNQIMALVDAEISPYGTEALEILKEYTLRPAKRVRGSLACLAYDAFNSATKGETGLKAAVVMELLQSYLLIIDDVADRSNLRRGLPSMHKLYEEKGVHGEYTSKMLAINVAALAQHVANLIVTRLQVKPKNLLAAIELMHRNIGLTGFGQIDDVAQNIKDRVSEPDILHMYRLKTGYYTFVNPLQFGAVLGGQTDKSFLEQIESFGQNAGIAFQLRDDILGLFGEPSETGKSNFDDINEGKNTLLFHHTLMHANRTEADFVARHLGNGAINEVDAQKVKEIVINSGALNYVEDKIDHYSAQAITNIEQTGLWDESTRTLLIQLVKFSSGRKA